MKNKLLYQTRNFYNGGNKHEFRMKEQHCKYPLVI
jgi:hypothetical protein